MLHNADKKDRVTHLRVDESHSILTDCYNFGSCVDVRVAR